MGHSQANSAGPDQTLHNAASDQVLFCLLTECTFKNLYKVENYYPQTLKFL